MPSELDVAVMYFVGILVGIGVTLGVQTYRARFQRVAWDALADVWDARLRG